jgi:hypothetical protein
MGAAGSIIALMDQILQKKVNDAVKYNNTDLNKVLLPVIKKNNQKKQQQTNKKTMVCLVSMFY